MRSRLGHVNLAAAGPQKYILSKREIYALVLTNILVRGEKFSSSQNIFSYISQVQVLTDPQNLL